MSVMSNLAYDIEQLYIEGLDPLKIAKEVGCTLSMVYEWLEGVGVQATTAEDSDHM